MKSIVTFIKNLQFIFMPSFWYMLYKICPIWDKKLNELLDKYEFTNVDGFTAYLGDNEIWIENYPSATFTPYINLGVLKIRASRLTILRAKKKLRPVSLIKNELLINNMN